jgi:hypothetical protein
MAEQEGVPLPVPCHFSWSGGSPTIIVGEKGEVTPIKIVGSHHKLGRV